ncbi:OLC1v1003329C1 [Oldenlandia corymbosa var. corymbosa]|uniref:OLC1v1003329C1 n=1 Tax=Oldenlandia corymbosa var. corymbosa TaxID=529605 RepID=A0AAV1DCL6_OLDCO|nr:OLC1v1003329C1 [Oldenlandia corymbosa var. corymbosa]
MVMTKKSPTRTALVFVVVAAVSQLFVAGLAKKTPRFPPAVPPERFGEGSIKDISLVVKNRDNASVIPELIGNYYGEMVTGYIKMQTHAGTHLVSHGYISPDSYTVDQLDFRTLVGPVLVVDIPEAIQRITADVLQSLNLPVGLKRVIFRTTNTIQKFIEKPFNPNYTGLTPDAATWLAQNTAIEFVGNDYVSVAVDDQRTEVYENLFAKPKMVAVEGLLLNDINPGEYTVYCFPLRLEAESSPARCILVQ